jgi:hypothetical protein
MNPELNFDLSSSNKECEDPSPTTCGTVDLLSDKVWQLATNEGPELRRDQDFKERPHYQSATLVTLMPPLLSRLRPRIR